MNSSSSSLANLRVSYDNNTMFCPGQGHVKTSRIVKESDTLVLVGSHTTQDDEVLLSALERVHTRHLQLLRES